MKTSKFKYIKGYDNRYIISNTGEIIALPVPRDVSDVDSFDLDGKALKKDSTVTLYNSSGAHVENVVDLVLDHFGNDRSGEVVITDPIGTPALTILNDSMMASLYSDVTQFRLVSNLPVNMPDLFTKDDDLMHTSMIVEELTELSDAVTPIDRIDAIVDSVYVLVGRSVQLGRRTTEIDYAVDVFLQVADRYGYNFLKAWDIVHASNMTKVCKDAQDFEVTKEYYANRGIKVEGVVVFNGIIVRCSEDYVGVDKTLKVGRILKSINYLPADLTSIVS